MKIAVVVLIIMAVMSIAGCGKQLKLPTKSHSEWSKDNKASEEQVRVMMREGPATYDPGHEIRLIQECMKEKGWQR